jgi:hypothetical protein
MEPRDRGLLSTAWGNLRRYLGIMSVKQRDISTKQRDMSIKQRDMSIKQRDMSVEQRDMSAEQRDSLCQGCQDLRDDLQSRHQRIKGEIWNMRPMKNADSCGGCALLVEGVNKFRKYSYSPSDLRVDYHASRLSVSYMDQTFVFAGLKGPFPGIRTFLFL